MRTGTTLAELSATLALLAVLAGLALPVARQWSDWAAVHGAREAVVSLVAGARRAALIHGGARVTFTPDPWSARLEADGKVLAQVHLEEDWGVALGRGTSGADLVFDGLALGRFASLTLSLERGGASAGLVVSSYGRVRRR